MWTLAEALDRTLPFSDAQELRWLRSKLRADHDGMDELQDMAEALDAIHASFRAMMAAGRLAGFGKSEAGGREFEPIPAKVWRQADIEWEPSALSYGRRASRVRMVSVRVRPLLHVPGAPALPAARSLASAFRTYVLDDPALSAILDRANGCFPGTYACMCGEVSRGMFTDETALWPAAIEEHDLAVEWMDAHRGRFACLAPAARRGALDHLAQGSRQDRAAFGIIRDAEAMVLDRVMRFLEPLRSGAVVAAGTENGLMGQSVVPREVWSRPTARIDFMRSELLTIADGPPERVWGGLVLSRLETSRASPVAPEAIPRNKGGRPATHAWPEAFDRLTIKLGRDGFPATGAALARLMADCFADMRAEPPDHEDIIGWLKRHKLPLWKAVTEG